MAWACADALNASSGAWTGPVGWDVDGQDWASWQRGASVAVAAQAYLDRVERTRRGIVLLHDSTADSEVIKAANRGYELTRALVPELLRRGYRFVGLDEVSLR